MNVFAYENLQKIVVSHTVAVKKMADAGNQSTPAFERALETALVSNASAAGHKA